jgi:hypothetical protein
MCIRILILKNVSFYLFLLRIRRIFPAPPPPSVCLKERRCTECTLYSSTAVAAVHDELPNNAGHLFFLTSSYVLNLLFNAFTETLTRIWGLYCEHNGPTFCGRSGGFC